MKYLCIGYFDPEKTNARPKDEIGAVMAASGPHMAKLLENENVLVHAGLELETRCLRRIDGTIGVVDGPFADGAQRIGVTFIVDAHDIDEAVRVASMHPAIQVTEGEKLGWGIEVRPIDSFRGALAN